MNKPTQRQIDARRVNGRRAGGWNKGKSYVIASGDHPRIYANKGGWCLALRRVYGDSCMNCGWNAARCDAHHIISKAAGGTFTLDNGVVICPNCHRLAHTRKITVAQLRAMKKRATVLVNTH